MATISRSAQAGLTKRKIAVQVTALTNSGKLGFTAVRSSPVQVSCEKVNFCLRFWLIWVYQFSFTSDEQLA